MDDAFPSFAAQLTAHARTRPQEVAIAAGRTLTFAELRAEVARGAALLASAGVGADSVLGLSIADEVEHLVCSLSALMLGCRQITLATFESLESHTIFCRRANVTHVCAEPVPARQNPIAGTVPIDWTPRRMANTLALPARSQGSLYLRTSGTTGESNIVVFSEAQLAAQAGRHADYATERLLRVAAIEHNNSKRHRLYCVYAGGTNVFRPELSVPVPDFCRQEAVTCLDISRLHAADLLRQAAGASRPIMGDIKLRTGGSSVPATLRRNLQAHVSPALYVRYAATECGAIAMAGPGQHDIEDSAGRPLDGVVVEIVDERDRPLPAGTSGEIRIKASGTSSGYLDSDEQSRMRFRDGWFYPGDAGSFGPLGDLFVHGRRDDMMILNGVNIFPSEIERMLESHPAVRIAAALPIASRIHGQIPVAAVELRDTGAATEHELQQFARQALGLRAPRRVLILEALPRTAQGKLLRREIAKLFVLG